jgi:hypothetical protein
MSHFTVMVVGEDAQEQLAPYQENNMGDCPKEYLKYMCWVNDREKMEFDSEEEAKRVLQDQYNPDESYWENPNRKWDWYQLGGRWTGFFKLHEGIVGVHGDPGIMTKPADLGYADCALKKDIDIEGMRDSAEEESMKRWEVAYPIVKEHRDSFQTWKNLRDKVYKDDIEAARTAYRNQPIIQEFQKHMEILGWSPEPEEFFCTEVEWRERARQNAIMTFAFLKDGVWYERGEMGMFAFVSGEKEESEWTGEFYELFDSIKDSELVSVYDCHI